MSKDQSNIVRWEGRAEGIVGADIKALVEPELIQTFAQHHPRQISVYDCFSGYQNDQRKKVILGVWVAGDGAPRTHIVKIGEEESVRPDYDGWRQCTGDRYIGSRLLVDVAYQQLNGQRAAAIYQNAFTLFGQDQKSQVPEFLHDVVEKSVMENRPDALSVERVIRQVYCDLQRWLYQVDSSESKSALLFYQQRLRQALPHWQAKSGAGDVENTWLATLRRDAIWLLAGHENPDSVQPADYIDPVDFVAWSLAQERIPATLVGRSHGDLHGRNVLVGVHREEAEYPVVIDYGEMDDRNVLAWDFVKLETELKTRLLPLLFEDMAARESVLQRRSGKPPRSDFSTDHLSPDERRRLEQEQPRAMRLAFDFEIESMLAEATDLILARGDAESRQPPGDGSMFGDHLRVRRALSILIRIRQEAALWLGFDRPGRHQRWRDEYYFALAVYGLNTVKWTNYEEPQIESALISAGVALARTQLASQQIGRELRADAEPHWPCCCYRIPLWHVHRKWKAGDLAGALALIESSHEQFPLAVPIQQEWALIQAEAGKLNEARDKIGPLRSLCLVFGDYETLSRIGRVLKNLGDREWEESHLPFTEISGRPPERFYRQAFTMYQDAFSISGHYFPAVNAMTLGLLIGQDEVARQYANQILAICQDDHESAFEHGDSDQSYWIFATEGEAALVSGRDDCATLAASYFEAALRAVGPDQIGMIQATWNQLCRLWHPLGESVVGPTIRVFRNDSRIWDQLQMGPLGNCGVERD